MNRRDNSETVSQTVADSVINSIWSAAATSGHYDGLRKSASAQVRKDADAAMDRHAKRQRDAGKAGW